MPESVGTEQQVKSGPLALHENWGSESGQAGWFGPVRSTQAFPLWVHASSVGPGPPHAPVRPRTARPTKRSTPTRMCAALSRQRLVVNSSRFAIAAAERAW